MFQLLVVPSAFLLSFLLCGLALKIAPKFHSGERKEGVFSAGQSLHDHPKNSSQVKNQAAIETKELPLIGSYGLIPGTIIAVAVLGYFLQFSLEDWIQSGIIAGGFIGFWLVGLLDDWKKVRFGEGIRERTKFIGVAFVSLAFGGSELYFIPNSRIAYSPYIDIPGMGSLFHRTEFVWPIFFMLLIFGVLSTTSLAVDFSDGLDGLAGGLMFPAAIAYAIITINYQLAQYNPIILFSLAMAGGVLGYLPWNWPSAWNGRNTAKRRAKMIMGDSGSLALGGLLAMIAIVDRQELLLLFIGGAFVLEGMSAVVQGRFLVKFYRRFLKVERFSDLNMWFPHTEFPLPFLATPLHHHFDLLGWDRRRLVYSAWLIGASMATIGVLSVIAPFTWERYFLRILIVFIAIGLWQMGGMTRKYFIGVVPSVHGNANLALFYGFPYKLFNKPLYALVEKLEVTTGSIASPPERDMLWSRMNVYDARAALGFFCYRAGYYALAREEWERIPKRNLEVRPQIKQLLSEARRRLTAEDFTEDWLPDGSLESAVGAEPSPADTFPMMRIPPNFRTKPKLGSDAEDTMRAQDIISLPSTEDA